MAFNQVEYIGPKDKVTVTPGKKGGGKVGGMLGGAVGGVAGGIAGFAGGGPAGAVAGSIAGAAGGASLGERLGEMVQPSRAETSAMERKVGARGPEVFHSEQSDKLKQSLLALQSAPPAVQQEYKPVLAQAYMTSVALDNPAKNAPGQPMRPTYG